MVKENREIVSSSKNHAGFELNFKTLRVKLPAIGSMRFLPNQEFVGTAKSITVKNDDKYWKIIVLAEYEDEETPDLTYAEIKNAIGIDVGVAITLATSNKENYQLPVEKIKKLEDEISVLQRRLKHKKKGSRSYRRLEAASMHFIAE